MTTRRGLGEALADGAESAPPATCDALDVAATLERGWQTWAPNAATVAQNPRGTIVPAQGPDSGGRQAVEELLELGSSREGLLTLEGTLGEGGMGIVHLATQRSVGRKVAVKTLRAEHRTPDNALRLLREAWLTGSLEHPNVLPVYDVAVDEGGCPRIVLKRIEGEPWSAVMHDAERARERYGAEEPLSFNLGVLMQVCRAVHFAHARGIVHRDLKPDNVMIGRFGEVYLLDWGIAVSLRDDNSGRLPLAKAATEIAGTPAYMAPEMLGAEIGTISERSDVYLLGAVLYELLMGEPPHQGRDARAVFSSVLLSQPKLGEHVPAELAAIVRRAMSADPADRYASAEEVRLALDEYLRLRGALRLGEQAQKRLAALERELAQDDAGERRAEIYQLFGECRVGFDEALAAYPEHEAARAGLAQLFRAMIDYELAAGDGRAAASLLAESRLDAPELRRWVDAAVAAQHERQSRLEELERQYDASTGKRTRAVVGGLLGTSWTLTTFAAGRFVPRPTVPMALALVLLFWLIAGAAFLWARDSMTRTAVNRSLSAAVFVGFAANVVSLTGAVISGLPHTTAYNFEFVSLAAVAAYAALTVERRLAPAAIAFAAGHLAASAWPERRFDLMAACQLVLTLNVVLLWRPRTLEELRRPRPGRRRSEDRLLPRGR